VSEILFGEGIKGLNSLYRSVLLPALRGFKSYSLCFLFSS